MVMIMCYGCFSGSEATSTALGENRHIVTVKGVRVDVGTIYQKWEIEASKVCHGKYTTIERHIDVPAPGYTVAIGTIECQ